MLQPWRLSKHAKFEMLRRNISHEQVEATLDSPEQVVDGEAGRMVYQRRFKIGSTSMLLRAVVAEKESMRLVVTVYLTSKISKYWSHE